MEKYKEEGGEMLRSRWRNVKKKVGGNVKKKVEGNVKKKVEKCKEEGGEM